MTPPKMSKFLSLTALLTLTGWWLAGCAPTPVKTEATPELAAQVAIPEMAELLRSGTAEEIADGYRVLAEMTEGSERLERQMRAVEVLVDHERFDQADRMMNSFPAADRAGWANHAPRRAALLDGLARLERGDTARALNTVQNVPVPLTPGESIRRLYLLSEIYQRLDLPVDSLRQRVLLDGLLEGEEAERNRDALWETLSRLPANTLRSARDTYPDQPLQGWLSLAMTERGSPADLTQWQEAHAGHPAVTSGFIERITPQRPILTAIEDAPATSPIAILLPQQGRFAPIGQAIRSGMEMSAALHPGRVPPLRFIDSGETADDLRRALDEALNARPAAIIGPLLKPQLQALQDLPAGSPPVIALNTSDADLVLPRNVIEYALAPEEDARAVARRMIDDGHYRALILTADTALGRRMARAFESEYQLLGGTVVSRANYSESETDFRNQIQPLLGSRSPSGRYNPTIRSDVDALFVGATPSLIVQLVPQIDYHGGVELPRYSTSLVYDGNPDPRQDQDKRGLIIPVSPLLLAAGSHPDDPRYVEFEQASLTGFPRLYAFGADAMTLTLNLARLGHDDLLEGHTGQLRLSGTQVVERNPAWGRFGADGLLRPLDGFADFEPPVWQEQVPELEPAGADELPVQRLSPASSSGPPSSEVPVFSDRATRVGR